MLAKDHKVNTPLGTHYNQDFFSSTEGTSLPSARVMVPILLKLVEVRSVVDIGCGTGAWLSVFQENGVEDIWGVDGPYVSRNQLKISAERFTSADLEQPFRMSRRFDLVVSLEVAEHLSKRSAETFVDTLTEHGPVVLFSAAIPNQGGVNHKNEQWPEYWANRFNSKGYVTIDALRKRVWNNENVEWWFAQNTLLFVSQEHLQNYPQLREEYEVREASPLSIVHPKRFLLEVEEVKLNKRPRALAVRTLQALLPHSIYSSLRSGYRLFTRKFINK